MKKSMLIALSALLVGGYAAYADDLVAVNGTTYKDVKITKKTPIGMEFISGGKAGWIDFRDLPADEAKKYGYDPAKAEEFEKKIAQSQGSTVDPNGTPPADIPDDANLNPQNIPQNSDNSQTIDPANTTNINFDPQYNGNAAPVYYGNWVLWGGRYYPYYWWHHWYWNNHWVYHNGRYYPWNYYHNHGTWDNRKYYPYDHYNHGPLKKEDLCRNNEAHNTGYHKYPEYKSGAHTNYARPQSHSAPHGGGGRR